MTELVTKRAKECSERGDFLLHGGPHPNSDQHGFRAVIPEQFACPVLANSQGPSRKDANVTFRNFIELRGSIQKLCAGVTTSAAVPVFIADSMDFAMIVRCPSCGRSRILISSLWINCDTFAFFGGES